MATALEPATDGSPAPYDVFLSYSVADREQVAAVRRRLSERGIRTFLDRHDLVAGLPWPQALEKALQSVRAVLVFVGRGNGDESLGLWQRREAWFALDRQAQDEGRGKRFPVVPVLLPGGAPGAGFLFLNTWIDLRDPGNESSAFEAIATAMTAATRQPYEGAPLALSPYRALEPFREEHAALFFGRETFCAQLLDRVVRNSIVALVGASGSGKSSIVQAGLVPLLRRRRPPQPAWDAVVFRPGDEPFHRLASSLLPLLEPEADEVDRLASARKLGDRLAEGTVRLEDVANRLIAKSNGTDRLLIAADQFEELFTLTPLRERQPFVQAVLGATARAPLTLLFSLRADFYGHAIALDRGLSDGMQSGVVNLGPMTRSELRRAVEQPAMKADASFEAGLVDRILDQVESQPGALPLLEFALTELWERRDGRQITHAAYEAIGEVGGAISRRAESVFVGLDAERKRAALSLFTRLVRAAAPGDPEPDTRRRVALEALTAAERGALDPFVHARLLVLDRAESAAQQTVEVAHEALIRGWSRLGEWVDQQREFLMWRQRLGQALGEWDRTGRDKDALLRGPALKEATAWARDRRRELSQSEADFIALSRRKALYRRGWNRFALGTIVAFAAFLAVFQIVSRSNAAQVRGAIYFAPNFFSQARPSDIAAWTHAVDVAGRLDDVGSQWLGFGAPKRVRLNAAQSAALVMAGQGRKPEAHRLAERAITLAKELPDLDSSVPGQFNMAIMLIDVGWQERALPFARRAFALARELGDPGDRAFALGIVAGVLGRVGLRDEASAAIDGARASLPPGSVPGAREDLEMSLAVALVELGEIEEARAIVSRLTVPGPSTLFVQTLLDRGRLEDARDLVRRSDRPLPPAMVASALAEQGRLDEARELTRAALARVEEGPFALAEKDRMRALLHDRLLLTVMTPSEGAELLRSRGAADELASFAVVLAGADATELARSIAREASTLGVAVTSRTDRARILAKVAEALALSGDSEQALAIIRAFEERDLQAGTIAHAAKAFAGRGEEDRARGLAREAAEILPLLPDPVQRSSVRATLGMVEVRLGRYHAALEDESNLLAPADRLAIYTAIIRDDALRRDGRLREAFDRGPTRGLGRAGVHWP